MKAGCVQGQAQSERGKTNDDGEPLLTTLLKAFRGMFEPDSLNDDDDDAFCNSQRLASATGSQSQSNAEIPLLSPPQG